MKTIFVLLAIFGLSFGAPKPKPADLIDDLQDFVNLLPLDQIDAIAKDHLATDGAFARVIVYLQGPEWAALVDTVGSKPAVQDFIAYLNDAGLPVDDIIAYIHNLIAGATPGVEPDENGSLRPLLDEIEAIIPTADLLALLNDKMQNSQSFQDFYAKVSSEDAHALVEEVRAIDEVQRLAQVLRDMGVKVDETLAWVYEFLGWGAPKKALRKAPRDLIDDLQDFINLLPLDQIDAIAKDHLATDGAFARVVVYLQGPEWAALVDTVGSKPAVQDFIAYLTNAGLPVDDIIAYIHNLIAGATPGVEPDENGSLRPLLDEIEAIIPTADLLALLNDKMQNSQSFQDFYAKVSSEDAHALVEEVRAIDEVQRLAQVLRDMGVKVDETLAWVYEFLGWGAPKKALRKAPRDLIDDLQDFINLLPLDQIDAIAKDHLATDGAFARVVVYLQGPEWAALVDTVGSKPAVQDFIAYLTNAGLPVDDIIAYIHNLIAGATPGVEPDENGSLRPLLDEIEAIIPTADLLALLNDKMQNSQSFQDFYAKVSSEDAHALVEEVRAIDEVQRLAQVLRDMGVKVDETLAWVYEFLGWGAPKKALRKAPRDLIDDLQDFINLLPLDQIDAIAKDHLATDGAFARVVVYLQGPEWAALVDTVGSKPAVQDFIAYLTNAGLPVDDIIAYIHNLIAGATPGVEPDENGSLRPLLDEIEAIIPTADLLALLNDKMQNSQSFQDFYAKVSSEDAHALVEEVRAIDEVQRLAQVLRDMGVKVDETLAWVYEFLGWGAPKKALRKAPRDLIDDLQDFINLLPLDQIDAIAKDHLATDGAFARVVVYLQGPEWAALVDTVGSKPAVQDFIAYLTNAGLPVDDIIAYIHNLIAGATPGVEPDENGSLRPLLDEIEAIIPTADLLALLNDKMQNSQSFQDFYAKVSSEDAHALVEEVRAIDEVQRLAQVLRDMGVKVDETLAWVYEFLGWGAPKKARRIAPRDLIDDLQDFVNLLPLDQIDAIAKDHLATDAAFARVVVYLQGPEWAALVDTVGAMPEVQDFIAYLNDAGLPVDDIIAYIHNLIAGATPGVEPSDEGSLRPLLDEIEAIIPTADLLALLNDKMQNSQSFQDFYARVSSEDAHALVEAVRALDEVQRLAQVLRDMGVHVDEALAWVYEFLGWGTPKKF